MVITFYDYVNQLNERFLNLFTIPEREVYKQEVFDLVKKSYAYAGGYAGDLEELVTDIYLWKLVRRNNKIVAFAGYKDKFGRKTIVCATDGSEEGKKGLIQIMLEDNKFKRAWSEVSDKAENLVLKLGYKPIPNSAAATLTGKGILKIHDDGFHYDRVIGGEVHTKMIVGHPKTGEFKEV